MKNKLYILFLLSTFFSCNNSSSNAKEETIPPNTIEENHKVDNQEAEFKMLSDTDFDLEKLAYKGEVVHEKTWQDRNGQNMVIFTKDDSNLFAYHYANQAGDTKLLRRVHDFITTCDYDLFLDFIAQSITISDLDQNNLGEITFAYRKACISDVSPKELKLLILENGEKYIIRGHTLLAFGEETIGGDKVVDPAFEQAPESFLQHAQEMWANVVKEY